MTKEIFALVLISSGLLISCEKSNKSILSRSAAKLTSIESIEYQVILEIRQKDAGLDEIDTAFCFFDFKNSDSLSEPKHHILTNHTEDVFNGKVLFLTDKNEKRTIYTDKPRSEQVNSSFFMINSIYLIKKLLPEFSTDPTATVTREPDTLVNGEENYCFHISIKDKARYMKSGVLITKEKWKTPDFKLFISKKTFMPTQFIDIYPDNGYWKSSFSSVNLSAIRPDSIWDYDRFSQDYLVLSSKEFGERMRTKVSLNVGQKSPNWLLPLVTGEVIQLSDLKGFLVLLEFWFPYCGGCVQAIPEINNIYNSYQQKNLKVFGIEFTQNDNNKLDEYIRNQGIKYPTLYKGQEVAKDYGVNAAPTFFLIDKKGFIIYSSVGLYFDDLTKVINNNN